PLRRADCGIAPDDDGTSNVQHARIRGASEPLRLVCEPDLPGSIDPDPCGAGRGGASASTPPTVAAQPPADRAELSRPEGSGPRPRAAHGLRGGLVPERLRVLGGPRGDLPHPRPPLHPP